MFSPTIVIRPSGFWNASWMRLDELSLLPISTDPGATNWNIWALA